jgi:hypothetical protein
MLVEGYVLESCTAVVSEPDSPTMSKMCSLQLDLPTLIEVRLPAGVSHFEGRECDIRRWRVVCILGEQGVRGVSKKK